MLDFTFFQEQNTKHRPPPTHADMLPPVNYLPAVAHAQQISAASNSAHRTPVITLAQSDPKVTNKANPQIRQWTVVQYRCQRTSAYVQTRQYLVAQ